MSRTQEPLPPSRYGELLEAAEDKSNRHGFTVHALGHTGLANTEFSSMSRNWLYPQEQELHVPENATGDSSPGRGRTIPLSQDSVKRFKEFFETQEEVDITPQSVTARVKSVGANALNEPVLPQTLRATFAVRLLQLDVPRAEIVQILGNSPSEVGRTPRGEYRVAEEKIRSGLY